MHFCIDAYEGATFQLQLDSKSVRKNYPGSWKAESG